MDVVLESCQPDGLAALALTACDFIDDLARITVTRQSPPSGEQSSAKQAASSTAAAEKPSDDTASASDKQASAADAAESSISNMVEDKVCIAGAVCLKVTFNHAYVSAGFYL